METWTYIDELAFILLADAVASELENSWDEARDDYRSVRGAKAKFARLRNEVIRHQEDIAESLLEACQDRGIDPTPFLTTDVVKRFIARVDAAWEGKATVAELYEADEKGAGRLILGGAGHGVDLGDDQDEVDWLAAHGIAEKAHDKAGHICDMYRGPAAGLIKALMTKLPDAEASA